MKKGDAVDGDDEEKYDGGSISFFCKILMYLRNKRMRMESFLSESVESNDAGQELTKSEMFGISFVEKRIFFCFWFWFFVDFSWLINFCSFSKKREGELMIDDD